MSSDVSACLKAEEIIKELESHLAVMVEALEETVAHIAGGALKIKECPAGEECSLEKQVRGALSSHPHFIRKAK